MGSGAQQNELAARRRFRKKERSPDGKAYLVGHGTTAPDPHPRAGNLTWITGDEIYLASVSPSPETINDMKSYEFYAGNGADRIIGNEQSVQSSLADRWPPNMSGQRAIDYRVITIRIIGHSYGDVSPEAGLGNLAI
ncbi:MAG: hypothetical protein MUQ25_17125 [Candidatus Aminicenantes bacterium]|nr:hypothetical protein [Candidatus Aminicenantes bacterium]